MKNITFQTSLHLAFIIIQEIPKGRSPSAYLRLLPIDLSWLHLLRSIHPVLAEVSHKQSRQSLPQRHIGTTLDIKLTISFVS